MLRRTLVVVLIVGGMIASAGAQTSPSELPELDRTGVVVPWEDFKKILEQLQRPTPTPPEVRPPVDFALSGCARSPRSTARAGTSGSR